MHYNPSSIALAQQTVDYEAEQNGVRAVLVESCPTRWNATLDAQPPGSLLRSLCDNEMQAGAEAGERVGATLVLGDQEIETTGKRVSALFAQTLVQLLTPRGWQLIAEDFANGIAQLRNPGGLPPTAGARVELTMLSFREARMCVRVALLALERRQAGALSPAELRVAMPWLRVG